MRAALILIVVATLPAGARAACPSQAPEVLATDGELRVCVAEIVEAVEVERSGGEIQVVPGPFAPGEPSDPVPLVGCAAETLRARAINAAGAGAWGSPVAATFPPCGIPVLVAPMP